VIKFPNRIRWAAIFVAWAIDFLFWEKSPGISFAVFVGIALGAGILLTWGENQRISRRAGWLFLPIILFAVATFIRSEPFTTLVNYLLVLLLMGILAHTLRGGRWGNYSLSDYVAVFFYLAWAAISRPIELLSAKKRDPQEESAGISRWQMALPFLRGFLIAIPILGLLTALLASADPIFAGYLDDFMAIFNLENLPEYIFRGFYILILAYLLSGIYLHALSHDKESNLIGEDKPWMPTFLGFTEAAIVLGSIDGLFITFVGIQFRYFFGGKTNIHLDGFTYAEYARRGFGELLLVAVFSLFLFFSLSTITRRETSGQRWSFSALGIGLVGLVAIILVSAFQRLLLYEQAYGFTRLRTYSHVFMIWLGVLLAALVGLELLKKQRCFGLAAMLVTIGFGLTLNILNVDRWIVVQNVQRVLEGNSLADIQTSEKPDDKLDTQYLQFLSADSVPAIIDAQQNTKLSQENRNELAAVLTCRINLMAEERRSDSWASYHWAKNDAWYQLMVHRMDFSAARAYQNQYGVWWVMVNGESFPCENTFYD
jgi:hypothetical protein